MMINHKEKTTISPKSCAFVAGMFVMTLLLFSILCQSAFAQALSSAQRPQIGVIKRNADGSLGVKSPSGPMSSHVLGRMHAQVNDLTIHPDYSTLQFQHYLEASSTHNPSYFSFEEWKCCTWSPATLTWGDIPPVTYTVTSSCPQLWVESPLAWTAADIAYWQSVYAAQKDWGPPWAGVGVLWMWSTGLGIVHVQQTCTVSSSDGSSIQVILDANDEFDNGCNGDCTAGGPITLSSGNVFIPQTDIHVPGPGGGLSLERVWNSKWPATSEGLRFGMFGPNWRSTYEEFVFQTDAGTKYLRADGGFWTFFPGGSPQYPSNADGTITAGDTFWTVTYKSGEKHLFNNATGLLSTIIDPKGNQTQISRDSLGRITTVTDPVSRHLYFTYVSDSSTQVSRVTSDFNITTFYAYDSQNRLTQVTKQDGSTISFEYNDPNPYLITAVKDSLGKVLETHTYDSSARGLTSSRANGVDAVSVSYQ